MDSERQAFRRGMIILWYGVSGTWPTGWVSCNGVNNTPDLRDRFVVSKGPSYALNETGGTNVHAHPVDSAEHMHTIAPGTGIAAGTDVGQVTNEVLGNIVTDTYDTRPLYYCLQYIMKL